MREKFILELAVCSPHAMVFEMIFEFLRIDKLVAILSCDFSGAALLILKLGGDSEVYKLRNHSSTTFEAEICVNDAVCMAVGLGEAHIS